MSFDPILTPPFTLNAGKPSNSEHAPVAQLDSASDFESDTHTNDSHGVDPAGADRGQAKLTISDCRAQVLAFAIEMERKLREHDPVKGEDSWKGDEPGDLAARALQEGLELREACMALDAQRWPTREHYAAVRDEAADVGNMAMMAADAAGVLL